MEQNRKDPPQVFASPSFDAFDDGDKGNWPEHVPCDMPLSPTQVSALFDDEEDAALKKKSTKCKPVELKPPAPPSMAFAENDDWVTMKPNPRPQAARGRLELAPGGEDAPAPFHQTQDEVDWSRTNIQSSPFYSKFGPTKMKGWSDQSQASATTATTVPTTSTVDPSSPAPATHTVNLSSPLRAETTDRNVGYARPSPSQSIEPRSPSPPPEEAPIVVNRETLNSPAFHETEATVVQSVEATLITNEPSMPVYDAVAIDNEGDGSLPWWKRYGKVILLISALTLIIGVLVGVVLTMTLNLGQANENKEPDQSSSTSSPSSSKLKRPSSGPSTIGMSDTSNVQPTKASQPPSPTITSTLIASQDCSIGISQQLRSSQSATHRTPLDGCSGYIVCAGLVKTDVVECPTGKLYNVKSEECEDSDNVQCEAALVAPPSATKPTEQPTEATTASTANGEIPTPIVQPKPAVSEKPTMHPTLRPSTVKPSPLPTGFPSTTESLTSSAPTSVLTPFTPFPTKLEVPKATPKPTPSPTTKKPTPKPTPSPITFEPTTRQPTPRPTPEPITNQPTIKPTPDPATRQPTSRPTTDPTTRRPTKRPSPDPTTRKPTPIPSPSPIEATPEATADEKSRLSIELQTDANGMETSWTLFSVEEEPGKEPVLIVQAEEGGYHEHEQDSVNLDLAPGRYRFTLKDSYKDGFCCKYGDGWYKISLEGREIISGDRYGEVIVYDIAVGYNPELSERDEDWLESHNSRRKEWHERYGETYMPLLWSRELAQASTLWAQELVNDCTTKTEPNIAEGENIAKNTYQKLDPADNILGRWVDNKATVGYPKNQQLTQVIWRASRYVGCGDAVKTDDGGSECRIHVCRYARAGNCAMDSYNAGEGDNWLLPMLEEYTSCGPNCPPGGCF